VSDDASGVGVLDKKSLSERDICTKFITPAIAAAGWDIHTQVREEVSFTVGRVIVRGRQVSRGEAKRADYILYYKPNIPLAVVEAKDNNHTVGDGMQQALGYADALDALRLQLQRRRLPRPRPHRHPQAGGGGDLARPLPFARDSLATLSRVEGVR
jgi:type I site-specific restriction endonuclease